MGSFNTVLLDGGQAVTKSLQKNCKFRLEQRHLKIWKSFSELKILFYFSWSIRMEHVTQNKILSPENRIFTSDL